MVKLVWLNVDRALGARDGFYFELVRHWLDKLKFKLLKLDRLMLGVGV